MTVLLYLGVFIIIVLLLFVVLSLIAGHSFKEMLEDFVNAITSFF